ncbi:MAG: bifunctional adenosylcobinamide kinase/adenosylcobinamide-phosphate guanylyltransferase [Spirochaetes bacterium]|nr:bifunctional adenosylcobinamide kinase/adenosylcobinamide-phosphate guanylyltransferase [Spirochaetota bacterium]
MILIFGGVYQGKLDYALDRFRLTEHDVYRCNEDDTAMPGNKKIIYEIDKWIFALVKADLNVAGSVQQFMDANMDAIVICNDISCGVVPADPVMRSWREAAGRSLALMSRNASEVVRLFCGIAMRIK